VFFRDQLYSPKNFKDFDRLIASFREDKQVFGPILLTWALIVSKLVRTFLSSLLFLLDIFFHHIFDFFFSFSSQAFTGFQNWPFCRLL